jgi:hypothetical protein
VCVCVMGLDMHKREAGRRARARTHATSGGLAVALHAAHPATPSNTNARTGLQVVGQGEVRARLLLDLDKRLLHLHRVVAIHVVDDRDAHVRAAVPAGCVAVRCVRGCRCGVSGSGCEAGRGKGALEASAGTTTNQQSHRPPIPRPPPPTHTRHTNQATLRLT